MSVVSSQMMTRDLVSTQCTYHTIDVIMYNYHIALLDEKIIFHQVKYLGLMENLRVRRAGFCYRRPFAVFLERYKSLCPKTWPIWKGVLWMAVLCIA